MANGGIFEFLLAGICAADGEPLIGGKVYTYSAGTLTPKATYTNRAQSIAAANPVILDSRGTAQIYGLGGYKCVIKDSADATVATLDNVYIYTGDPATAPGADLDLGGFKFLNVGEPALYNQFATVRSLLQSAYCGTSGGSANALTLSRDVPYSAYLVGERAQFKASLTNTADAPTLNISSFGTKTILRCDGKTCRKGDIVINGIYEVVYDGTNFLLLNPTPTWQTWTPSTQTASGAMTVTGITNFEHKYRVGIGDVVEFEASATYTLGGVADAQIFISLPVAAIAHSSSDGFSCFAAQNNVAVGGGARYRVDATPRIILSIFGANWTLGANAYYSIKGSYQLG